MKSKIPPESSIRWQNNERRVLKYLAMKKQEKLPGQIFFLPPDALIVLKRKRELFFVLRFICAKK